jgi:hypothetical protein
MIPTGLFGTTVCGHTAVRNTTKLLTLASRLAYKLLDTEQNDTTTDCAFNTKGEVFQKKWKGT